MSHSVFNGFISFGMINIPIKMYTSARNEGTAFNNVHECNNTVTKIAEKKYCGTCESIIEPANLKKGYEVSKGKFVIVEQAELDNLKPDKSDICTISHFVPLAEIDPVFFDKSYSVVPQPAGVKVYELLYQTMNNTNLAGVAKLTMRGNEYNVLVRTYKNGLMLHTVFTNEEVREVPEYEASRSHVILNKVEVDLAKKLLQSLVKNFDPTELKDDYTGKVQALIARKTAVDGTYTGTSPNTKATSNKSDIDLTGALMASLYKEKKPPETETTKKRTKKANG